MSQRKTVWIAVSAVVLVLVAFCAGVAYQNVHSASKTASGTIPAPTTPPAPLFGTITSASASSITVTLSTGGTRQITIGSATHISEGSTPKEASDLTVGTKVMIGLSSAASSSALYIQILPAPPTQ